MRKFAIAGFVILAVVAALLVCGPYILGGIPDKRKEWERIMDDSQDEK